MRITTGSFGRVPFARVDGRDPLVVLSGGQAFVQRATPERIAKDARRLARILPAGRGFTMLGYPPADAGTTLDSIAEEVAAAIEGGPVDLVGVSYGGMVAVRVAARHPERVRSLVLVVSAAEMSAEGRARVDAQIRCAQVGDLVGLVEGFAAVFRRRWLNALLAMRLRLRRRRLADGMNEPAAIVHGLGAIARAAPVDLAAVAARTLLVGGSRDQFFDTGAVAIAGAKSVIFDGETHMVPVERSRDVARAIEAFLRA